MSCRAGSLIRTTHHRVCRRNQIRASRNRGFAEQSSPNATRTEHERRSHSPGQEPGKDGEDVAVGAMSQRLADLMDSNIEEGGRSAAKAIEDSGFDEELKERLLSKVEEAKFQNEYSRQLVHANISRSAGKGTQAQASAQPWTGEEAMEDAALRMLTDKYKPLRGPPRIPNPPRLPKRVDTGRPKKSPSSGARLANARDKASSYTSLKDEHMSDKEKEKFRKELKDRFTPGARPMPGTIQGLASLANERIEDAIARGQFKNLPRGQKIERDYNMSSPFLDTTEYFMNKIIQKQEIVPPWIEKQQELISAANQFRARLRSEWRRHAARTIASHGGSLEAQVARAQQYADAESTHNPTKKKEVRMHSLDDRGLLSQITLSGELKPATAATKEGQADIKITATEETVATDDNGVSEAAAMPRPPSLDERSSTVMSTHVFRDSTWEHNERTYHTLAIENLNNITRSYNLMAPNVAKKPYYSLERELRSCYAEVAQQLPNEIRQRAMTPNIRLEMHHHKSGGVLEKFSGTSAAKIYDSKKPPYGFREFWRDLFGKKASV